MTSFRIRVRSVVSWFSMRRSAGFPRAGDVVGFPDGTFKALPKDLVDMSADDLAAMGVVPGSQPDFFVPR